MKTALLLFVSLACFAGFCPAQTPEASPCRATPSSAYQKGVDQTLVSTGPITLQPQGGAAFTFAALFRYKGESFAGQRPHFAFMVSSTGERPRFTGTGYHELVAIADGVRTPLGPGAGSPDYGETVRETAVWSIDAATIRTLAAASSLELIFGAYETKLSPCDITRLRTLVAEAHL